MSDESNLQIDISVRHFPGDEEPTPEASWVALATVLLLLAAILVYSLHLAAPDPQQEYTDFMESHPPADAAGHLAAARLCDALGGKLDARREVHLTSAYALDPALPGLETELRRLYADKSAAASSAPAHVALAEWCLGFNMRHAAGIEYGAALKMDPNHTAAKKGLEDLKK